MRELGIVPVFPPREDVYVGDLYASVDDPDSAKNEEIFLKKWRKLDEDEREIRRRIGMSPRLGRLDLIDEINAEYERTISAPPTPDSYNTILGNAAAASLAEAAAAEKKKLASLEAAKKKIEADRTSKQDALEKATRDKQDAQRILTRLTEDEKAEEDEAKKAKIREQMAAQVKVVRAAEDAEIAAERAREAHEADTAAELASTEQKIADAKADIAAAKTLVKQLESKAEKLLYTQPVYERHNLYAGTAIEKEGDAINPATSSRINRMRLVGFPEFVTATFDQGDLSALIPIEGFLLGIDASGARVSKVSVKVPAAESYGISMAALLDTDLVHRGGEPPYLVKPERKSIVRKGSTMTVSPQGDVVLDEYVEFGRARRGASEGEKPDKLYLRPDLLDAIRFQSQSKDTENKPRTEAYVRVITEVYYARALDVNVFFSQAIGGRATVRPPVPAGGDGGSPAASTTEPADPAQGLPTPTGADPLASVIASIKTGQDVPGGAVQFISSSSRSIGLRRVFHRPVAIGFRGVTLKVRLRDGYVSDVGVAGGITPQVAEVY